MRRTKLTFAGSSLLVLTLWACSNGNDAGGDQSGTFPPVDPGGDDGSGGGPSVNHPPFKSTNAQPKITECGRALAKTAGSTCTTTKTGSGSVILRGSILGSDEVLHTGEVVVGTDGLVACTGCDCASAPGYDAATVIECATGVVTPGLINPHEHITYSNNAPAGHGTERYDHRHDWRIGKRGHTKLSVKGGASPSVVTYAELRYVMGGATTIAGAGGAAGLLRNVDNRIDSLEGAPAEIADSDTFPLGDTNGTMLTNGCAYPKATKPGSIATLEAYLPHISEGIDNEAHNEFACTSTGMTDLMKPQTAVIHSIAVGPEDAAKMRASQSSVVWSPRSNIDLYGNTAPVTMLDAEGVQISLGTDWIASGSMNLLRELKCADSLNTKHYSKHFSDADLWRMVTVNAAHATGTAHVLGSLKPGYLADIAVFEGSTAKDFRAVIDGGVEDVALVLRGGKPMYGDSALLDSANLGGVACQSLSGGVCGQDKSVCLDSGLTLEAVRAAGEAFYPLFFCKDKTPDNEPSCSPYREEYKDGVTDSDKDGDGIADAIDNCPTIFNPIRPMDSGKQADADADGTGDACDPCPRDAKNACVRPSATDSDGDGIADAVDNCPSNANPDQADTDKDGRGNACESCADANPGAIPCDVGIEQLRKFGAGRPKNGEIVRVGEAFISAIGPASGTKNFMFIQSGLQGAPFQGLYVITGSSAGQRKVGEKIALTGVYRESYGMDQVTVSNVEVLDGTLANLEPMVISPADLANDKNGEGYESLLVRIEGEGLAITDQDPDKGGKYFEFSVGTAAGAVRIDDFIFSKYATTGTAYPPVGFTNGSPFTSITGVMGYSFNQRKLYPRDAADVARPAMP